MPTIDRITVYPIKSLDGHDITEGRVLANGALWRDRQYALVDAWGKYVNGKRFPAIHRIRATFSEDLQSVRLSASAGSEEFDFATQQDQIAEWCGQVLGVKCRLIENSDGGFPDDSESPGMTLVSTSSLQSVSDWFDDLDLSEARRRFRFNVEVSGTSPFWEDRLVADTSSVSRFSTGKVVWQGNGICRRCVVPTRNSHDGTATADFARVFVEQRERELPAWAPRDRFDTFYRLGVNTRIESADLGAVIRIGDSVSLTADR